jgi:hypothetical protein
MKTIVQISALSADFSNMDRLCRERFAKSNSVDAPMRGFGLTGKSPISCPVPLPKIFRFSTDPNQI